jgi:hypothetical protein
MAKVTQPRVEQLRRGPSSPSRNASSAPRGGAESTGIESEVGAWTAEMDRRGVRLQGEPLRSVSRAATVRVRGGDVLVSDGPVA